MTKFLKILIVALLVVVTQRVTAQEVFVTEGETVVYRVWLDETIQDGTVSDALQNLPGVRVDMEGNITLRGVNNVEIFINDQASHFNEDTQKNYIQQTSVASIKEIMVMANPSARYTTASNTGVINIITKDDNTAKQNLNVGFQVNTLPDYSPWISYSYDNNKVSFSANVKGTYNKTKSHADSYGYLFEDETHNDTVNILREFGKEESERRNMTAGLQFGYKFDKKNIVNFYLTAELDQRHVVSYDSTYYRDTLEYRYITDKKYDYTGLDARTGVMYKHLFDERGHALSLSFNTLWMPGESDGYTSRRYLTNNHVDRSIRERNIYSDFHWDAKAEYNLPYSDKGEFYVALMKTHRPDGNQLLFDTLAVNEYVRDTLRTEIRNYYTDKNELLINLQHRLGRFTVKPGVNFDYTVMTAYFPKEKWYDFKKDFFKVHPSLFVTYSTKNQHNFSIGYTHKTDYPYVRKFSRRVLYQEDSYDVGNFDLKPASMHVIKVEWTKYWEKFGSVGINAYYKGISNQINDVVYKEWNAIYGRYITYTKPVNLGGYNDAGAEFNITYRPMAMLNVRFYANLYNSHLEYPETEDEIVVSDMFCYNLTMNVWTKLWNRLELHASAYYNSKTQTLYQYLQTPYGVDCGMRMDFFRNRMSLLINVNDLFDWNKTDSSISQPTYEFYSTEKIKSRFVSAEIIFKII